MMYLYALSYASKSEGLTRASLYTVSVISVIVDASNSDI